MKRSLVSDPRAPTHGSRFTIHERRTTNKGMVLLLTFIILTALTAIVVIFLYLTSTQLKGTAYDVASRKALWLAEAGLQKAIYNLNTNSTYGGSPTAINGTLGDGYYNVTVTKSGTTYNLTSIGTVGLLNKTVRQSLVVPTGHYQYQTGYGLEIARDWDETN